MGYNQQRYDRWEWEQAERAAVYGVAEDDDDGYDKLRDMGAFEYERRRDWTLGRRRYSESRRSGQ